jgi:hypothetical protein
LSEQIHIRDAETARILRETARQTGRSMTDILRDAVRGYRPPLRRRDAVDAAALLAADRRALLHRTGEPDDLYDEDGLPR